MTTDSIHIEGLRLRTIIGLNDWERENRQDVVIDIVLHTDVRRAGNSDAATDITNYRTVTKAVIEHVEASSYHLVEALATAIARICVVDFGVAAVTVRVDKPGALRFADTVAVEIERTREDFD